MILALLLKVLLPLTAMMALTTGRLAFLMPKKQWCCLHKGVACAIKSSSEATDNTSEERSKPEPVGKHYEEFDCLDGVENWQRGFSDAKKEWCCLNKHVACPEASDSHAQPQSSATGLFDCSVDKVEQWPEQKQRWCCDHKAVGCTLGASAEPYNCMQGASNWQNEWPEAQSRWCCEHKGVACPAHVAEPVPFDCKDGLENWQAGFSDLKKEWCCLHEHVACAGAGAAAAAKEKAFSLINHASAPHASQASKEGKTSQKAQIGHRGDRFAKHNEDEEVENAVSVPQEEEGVFIKLVFLLIFFLLSVAWYRTQGCCGYGGNRKYARTWSPGPSGGTTFGRSHVYSAVGSSRYTPPSLPI